MVEMWSGGNDELDTGGCGANRGHGEIRQRIPTDDASVNARSNGIVLAVIREMADGGRRGGLVQRLGTTFVPLVPHVNRACCPPLNSHGGGDGWFVGIVAAGIDIRLKVGRCGAQEPTSTRYWRNVRRIGATWVGMTRWKWGRTRRKGWAGGGGRGVGTDRTRVDPPVVRSE